MNYWKKFVQIVKKSGMVLLLSLIIFSLMTKKSIAPIVVLDETQKNTQIYDVLTTILIKEVDSYIKFYGPNSTVSAEMLVKICDQYSFDLKLMLAQGQLESHFGTRGLAVITNSVFNVGAFDNGTILYTYEEPNESIEPYVNLIKKYYLVGKSVNDLLTKRFVNYDGKRYASNWTYERRLRGIISDMSGTDLDKLLSERQQIGNKIHKFVDYIKPTEPINYLASTTSKDYYFDSNFGR